MVKKEKAKQGKPKTKEELLEVMNAHFNTQQELAEKLKKKALIYIDLEDSGEDDSKANKKKKNQYLYAYNQQVDAVSRTATMMIRIQGSSLKEDDSQEEKENESSIPSLVD